MSGRQDILMALLALVQGVLSWPISTPYQSFYYESIVFKFREGDYVTEDTNPDMFSFDHVSGEGLRLYWSSIYTGPVPFYLFIYFLFAFSGA